MSVEAARESEIRDNFKIFREILPRLMKDHAGEFALLRHQQIIKYFNTASDAMIYGTKTFEDGLFSVQEVSDTTIDLGWFSHGPLRNDL